MAQVTVHRTHNPEEVAEAMRDALTIVEEVDPPDDLRVQAFTGAFNLLSAKVPVVEQTRPLDVVPEHLLRPGL